MTICGWPTGKRGNGPLSQASECIQPQQEQEKQQDSIEHERCVAFVDAHSRICCKLVSIRGHPSIPHITYQHEAGIKPLEQPIPMEIDPPRLCSAFIDATCTHANDIQCMVKPGARLTSPRNECVDTLGFVVAFVKKSPGDSEYCWHHVTTTMPVQPHASIHSNNSNNPQILDPFPPVWHAFDELYAPHLRLISFA
ncbi:hypothetical protein BJ742DRAFT_414439 [Cladochytrium replicatum]|nr:hypothetical protein BJ742DRAFT_414439 [Cladochytrium replicatum]